MAKESAPLLQTGFLTSVCLFLYFDPLGQHTVTAGKDNCFRTCCPSVRPHFSKSSETKKVKTMFAAGETVGLAEWIIDDTCLVPLYVCSPTFAIYF